MIFLLIKTKTVRNKQVLKNSIELKSKKKEKSAIIESKMELETFLYSRKTIYDHPMKFHEDKRFHVVNKRYSK